MPRLPTIVRPFVQGFRSGWLDGIFFVQLEKVAEDIVRWDRVEGLRDRLVSILPLW